MNKVLITTDFVKFIVNAEWQQYAVHHSATFIDNFVLCVWKCKCNTDKNSTSLLKLLPSTFKTNYAKFKKVSLYSKEKNNKKPKPTQSPSLMKLNKSFLTYVRSSIKKFLNFNGLSKKCMKGKLIWNLKASHKL